MSYVLWTLASLVSFVGGLVILIKVTPKLSGHSFDEGMFMGIAALDILGGLLAFGAVAITYIIFNASLVIKVLDFFFLVGILIVSVRIALYCLRPHYIAGTFRVSRIIAGAYCLFLAAAAALYVIQLFIG